MARWMRRDRPSRNRSVLRAAPFLVFALAPLRASAATRSTHLVYVRAANAAQCADEAGMRSAVSVRLGYDPFVAYAETTLVVEIRAARAGGFEADVRVVRGDGVEAGHRKIAVEDPDCQAAIDALALTLSIIVDPVAALHPASVAASPVDSPAPPAPSSPPSPAPDSSPEPSPRAASPIAPAPAIPTWIPSLALSSFASVAEAPSLSAGLLLSAALRTRFASLGLDLRADLPAARSFNAGTIRSHTTTAWAVTCAHVSWFDGCALFGAGALFGSSDVATSAAFTWSFGARAGATVSISARFFFQAFVDLVVTPAEARYELAGAQVYRLPPVGGDVAAGLGVRFP